MVLKHISLHRIAQNIGFITFKTNLYRTLVMVIGYGQNRHVCGDAPWFWLNFRIAVAENWCCWGRDVDSDQTIH